MGDPGSGTDLISQASCQRKLNMSYR